MSTNGHVPPQNLDAEDSLLGAMMLSPAAIEAAAEETKPEDFYRPSSGMVFRAALEMHDRGDPVDAITLRDELAKRGQLKHAGGEGRLHQLATIVPATSNARHYAKIVRETAGLRALILAGDKIKKLGLERPGTIEELSELAEQALTGAVRGTVKSQFTPLADELDEIVAEIDEAYETGVARFGLRTGYIDLDNVLTGLHPGTLTLIAARPGMGKSTLALNIAENVADKIGTAGVLSLEMSKRELAIRSLSRASQIDSQKLRTGRIDATEYERFRKGQLVVRNRKALHVEDNPGINATTLRAEARRMHRLHGLDLLVVDYLQLMLSGVSEESRQNEIANISRSMKLLARELGIPVIALSQLNRKLEARESKRPQLSDLRDSGALEQDADTVLFIYRDEFYNPDSTAKGIAEIIVAKNRMGPSDTIKLAYVTRHSTFKNLAKGTTE